MGFHKKISPMFCYDSDVIAFIFGNKVKVKRMSINVVTLVGRAGGDPSIRYFGATR